jgi:hypothetical protein
MSKIMDAAEEWADMIYPELKSGPHSLQRDKIRTAYMLGFERGYKIAARARLLIEEDYDKPSKHPQEK